MPIIEQYLLTHWDDDGLGSARVDPWPTSQQSGDDLDPFTARFGVALAEIEWGVLTLTLAESAPGLRERHAQARTARQAFEAAQVLLRPATRAGAVNPEAGYFWQEEARQGLNAAKQLLQGE